MLCQIKLRTAQEMEEDTGRAELHEGKATRSEDLVKGICGNLHDFYI